MRLLSLILIFKLIFYSSFSFSNETKIKLGLDWFINPDHAPIIIAEQYGYFKENGLKVAIIEPADPNDPPKQVAAGKIDIAISYQPQFHLQIDQSLPIVRLGSLVSTPLNSLVVLKDGPIKSRKYLKNKIFYATAKGVGTPIIYVGAKTGRDGIHGATMAVS